MAERVRPLSASFALLGLTELNNRFTALQKEFAELRDQLNVFENWNSEIKKMYGKRVEVITVDGAGHEGILIWSDRYNVCIEHPVECDPVSEPPPTCGTFVIRRKMIMKGSMISIELTPEEG